SQAQPWVAGFSTLLSSSVITRQLGPLGAPSQITGLVNVQAEAALFGQVSYAFTPALTGTVGERLTLSDSTGFLIGGTDASGRTARSSGGAARLSATRAPAWRRGGRWSAFFHSQRGSRPGGLAVAPAGSGAESQKFRADNFNMDEVGLRWGDRRRDRL